MTIVLYLISQYLGRESKYGIIFLHIVEQIWDTFKELYGDEKNIFRIFGLYEHLLLLSRGKCLFQLTFQHFVVS